LVAGILGRRWNDALLKVEEFKKQYPELERKKARVATPEQKAKVMTLVADLPRLWNAPTTEARDRKRMLRLLIKDITVEKQRGGSSRGSVPFGSWRIERDYQKLKQELGLGHYEGRNWRDFHHHATLCIAA
jgi:hypothetical protein